MTIYTVTLENDGRCYRCSDTLTLVEGMESLDKNGIPAGCRGGGCGVCKVQVLSGSYTKRVMSREHVSEQEEFKGCVLACRVRPTSAIALRVSGKIKKTSAGWLSRRTFSRLLDLKTNRRLQNGNDRCFASGPRPTSVLDMNESVKFYTDVMGLVETGRDASGRVYFKTRAERDHIIGLKAGLTSHTKMKQMGVSTPVFGCMADYYAVPDGGECRVSELIHRKVEPEIAFVTKIELRGPGCHIGAVLAASDLRV